MLAVFIAEARRQGLLANASPEETDIQAFIDSVIEWPADCAMTMPQQLTRGWRVSSTSASSTVATSVS